MNKTKIDWADMTLCAKALRNTIAPDALPLVGPCSNIDKFMLFENVLFCVFLHNPCACPCVCLKNGIPNIEHVYHGFASIWAIGKMFILIFSKGFQKLYLSFFKDKKIPNSISKRHDVFIAVNLESKAIRSSTNNVTISQKIADLIQYILCTLRNFYDWPNSKRYPARYDSLNSESHGTTFSVKKSSYIRIIHKTPPVIFLYCNTRVTNMQAPYVLRGNLQ